MSILPMCIYIHLCVFDININIMCMYVHPTHVYLYSPVCI